MQKSQWIIAYDFLNFSLQITVWMLKRFRIISCVRKAEWGGWQPGRVRGSEMGSGDPDVSGAAEWGVATRTLFSGWRYMN